MFNLFGGAVLAYLVGSGLATNASAVGRGLVRAVRKAVAGNLHDGGVEALAALAVPVAMSYAAMSALVAEVVSGAANLAGDALEGATVALPGRDAA